jgi:DNA-binding MarR family transcriptional regulator
MLSVMGQTATSEQLPRQATSDTITRLRLVVTRLSRKLRQQADVSDLTPSRMSALSTIDRLGPVTLSELAAAEQVQPPTMTRIATVLEDSGLVVREVDETDRRSARVRVSPAGARVLSRSRSKKNLYLAGRLRGFTPAEVAQLEQALPLLERLAGDR